MNFTRIVSLAAAICATAASAADAPRLVNLSTRAQVGTGDDVVITGFVLGSGANSTVLIRALGPMLSSLGVNGALADPTLTLHDATGAVVDSNDNWKASDGTTMNSAGAFALTPSSKDAAIVRTLTPGVYSARVTGVGATVGLGLLELYEIGAGTGSARLTNLSTRTQIGVGDNILISGLVIANGSGSRRLLVRASGPALLGYGVTGALRDPVLKVVNSGTGATVATNDNWETPATPNSANAATLVGAFQSFGAAPFTSGSKDAALIVDLAAGRYSINVSGAGDTTGVALAEVYDITTEGLPVVTVVATKATADESGSNPGEITFARTGDVSLPLTVTYSFGGTATAGIDYTAGTGTAVIPANAGSLKIEVTPRVDVATEGSESVVITLNGGGSSYSVGAASSATVTIADLPASLYVANLRPSAAATTSTGSGTATILLSPDGSYAYVSLTFSNLSANQTVAYLRLGNAGEVGTELLRLTNGQVDGAYWGIRASGALSAADIVQALRDGRIFVSIESSTFPGGELRGAFILGAGSQTFTTPSAPPALDLSVISDTDAARFLTQATFGATPADIDALRQKGYSAWFAEQLAKPVSVHRDAVNADFAANNAGGQNAVNGLNTRPGSIHRQAAWWKIALTGDDQLRQRVALALSEILVISDVNGTVNSWQEGAAHYYDILVRQALGNYRTLLEDVTLSPMMGVYLSHLRNARATSATGPQPDENYAREVMQLFTIGLNQLQPDGTLKLDANAVPLPTYTQATVTETAKVFTGWAFYNTTPTTTNFRNSTQDYFNPMTLYSGFHDVTAKTIVGGLVLPANRTGAQDLKDTLDALVNHPNTGPFVCRQLIQRLVTSTPSPAYVYRVAQVFANNGAGVRGDLAAVVRAILMDYEARSPSIVSNAGYGKLKEPLLRVTQLLRAANVSSSTGRFAIGNANAQIGEQALSAPSVFNFFEPFFVQPGMLAAAGLNAPEFQILTASTAMSTPNYLYNFLINTTYQGVTLNYTDLLPLATQPTQLIDRLNLLFSSNAMSATAKTRLIASLNALPASTTATDRIKHALYLVTTTPEGAVQR